MSDDDLVDPAEIEKLLADAGVSGPPTGDPSATPSAPPTTDQPASAPTDQSLQSGTQPNEATTPDSEGSGATTASDGGSNSGVLAADEIEALLQQAASSPDRLVDNAAAGVAAAMAVDREPEPNPAQPFVFEEFGASTARSAAVQGLSGLEDVELDLRIELGRTEMLIEDVLKLKSGSVVELDKLAGDPVDILVNGRLVARGEVLVLNDNFCVRVAEILSPES